MSRWIVPSGISQPAVGADIVYAPVKDACWRLLSLQATLTTSATVATRTPALEIVMGDGELLYAKAVAAAQTAGTAVVYSWAKRAGQGSDTSALAGLYVADGVPDYHLPNLAVIKTVTLALQATDQWSNVFCVYEVDPSVSLDQYVDSQQTDTPLPGSVGQESYEVGAGAGPGSGLKTGESGRLAGLAPNTPGGLPLPARAGSGAGHNTQIL